MYARHVQRSGAVMGDNSDDVIQLVTERFERRMAEENGHLRVEMATEFGEVRAEMATEFGKVRAEMATEFGKVRAEMANGFGGLRSEMIDRNAELLKWGLLFGVTQTAALAGVMALLR
jgi:hypothetical protein